MKMSRRAFMAASSASVALAALPAIPAFAKDYVEPPSLKDQVSGGKLPPVGQRLPENPLVITPTEKVGTYGGDWNMALVGGGGLSMLFRYQAYEPLVRFTPDWSGVTPNVAESVEADADSKVYTIKLRKGLKWSDGEPFTTDDVKFWYDTCLTDKRVAFVGNAHWKQGGKPAKLDVVDETTFKVTFEKPNGFFPLNIAWANNDQTTRTPKHYLSQFHIDYNPKADDLAKQRGLGGWVALFQQEAGFQDDNIFFQNGNRPSLFAWQFQTAPGAGVQQAVAVRNPYYFKVDTSGNQLPYMDRVVYQMVADPQVLLLKCMQGQIDMMDQYIGTPANKSVLYDNRQQGNYDFYTLNSTEANQMVFCFNLNHNDPVRRELFQNKDFRVAMSLALDRQSLIDTVLVGQGAPAQPSILKSDPLYNEQLATQFTEFDPDKANAMLDKIIPNKGDDGIRLDKNGKKLTITFEIDNARAVFIDMLQLVVPMFQAVGIDAQVRTMDRSLWETRVRQGRDFDATCHEFGANGGIAAMLDPRYYVPTNNNAVYAPGWQLWYQARDNKDAIEPDDLTKKSMALYDQLQATSDPAKQKDIMKQILQNAADEFYVFGVTQIPPGYGIVKNNLHNFTKTMPNSFGWPTPAPTRPEQFYKA
ncbi:MAG TPA: ABC transporter substrate-binding protein [Rhodopila sp.]|uniref:ABC transporter substrate-binding protein n=1 Tax=Rhodopila sp. TaxID=2480087 RepID=UPI002C28A1A9|nr:ABC transporter substrate-binding protein [Rhodopila sp.]HVY17745.1 ABC transporter substrate-binding protein [Rhodopila sp.]